MGELIDKPFTRKQPVSPGFGFHIGDAAITALAVI
jgi:hypothetical protein